MGGGGGPRARRLGNGTGGQAKLSCSEEGPRSLVCVSSQPLHELIETVTVDAYEAEEQLTAFPTVFAEEVTLPCAARILDIDVEVVGFDVEGDDRRGVVARCRRGGGPPGVVALADVRFEPATVVAWLHAALWTWVGLEAFASRRPARWSWPEP